MYCYLSPNIYFLFIPWSPNFLPGPWLFGEMTTVLNLSCHQVWPSVLANGWWGGSPNNYCGGSLWKKGVSTFISFSSLLIAIKGRVPRFILEYELDFLVITYLCCWVGRTPECKQHIVLCHHFQSYPPTVSLDVNHYHGMLLLTPHFHLLQHLKTGSLEA